MNSALRQLGAFNLADSWGFSVPCVGWCLCHVPAGFYRCTGWLFSHVPAGCSVMCRLALMAGDTCQRMHHHYSTGAHNRPADERPGSEGKERRSGGSCLLPCPKVVGDSAGERESHRAMTNPNALTEYGRSRLALTRVEAAKALGVTAITVDRLAKRGLARISSFRRGEGYAAAVCPSCCFTSPPAWTMVRLKCSVFDTL